VVISWAEASNRGFDDGKMEIAQGQFFVYCAFSISLDRVYRLNTFLQINPAIIKPNPINQIFNWEHPEFANISVGAKHDRSKSLLLTKYGRSMTVVNPSF
jgi:hypothetical protein